MVELTKQCSGQKHKKAPIGCQQSSVIIDCPLCGHSRNKRLFFLGNKLFPVNVSICQNCGFVFQNPRFTEAEWDSYYDSDYDTYHRPLLIAGQLDKDPDAHAREIHRRLKTANLKDHQSILEIGAGKGDILDYFMRENPAKVRPLAIEPSVDCQKVLKNRGVKVIGSSIKAFSDETPQKVDLIIMRHVLEHLYNPLDALSIIKDFMKEDSALYVAVPNLFSREGGTFHFPHISYFNNITLGLVASKLNLSAVILEEKNDELYGIFKVNGVDHGTFKMNYEITLRYLKNRYRNMIKNRIKRELTYLIPKIILRNLLIGRRKV